MFAGLLLGRLLLGFPRLLFGMPLVCHGAPPDTRPNLRKLL
jgi:hypothetical protein